jgi:hypothetical protein
MVPCSAVPFASVKQQIRMASALGFKASQHGERPLARLVFGRLECDYTIRLLRLHRAAEQKASS